MLLRKRKILCYVLVFDQVDIIKKTLDFLTKSSDKLEIVVIENPSPNTPHIKRMIDDYGQSGLVKRYYLFDGNVTGNAFRPVLTEEQEHIKKSPYVLISDGDLTCDDPGWLNEELKILKRHRDVLTCGISLSRSNLPLGTFPDAAGWIPADKNTHKDYYEAVTGCHLLLFRGNQFSGFIDWMNENDLTFVDGQMHRYCYDVLRMKWSRTKKAEALHLTWDLYNDMEHPYTKMKLDKSFRDTWYHQDSASFTLTEY